MGVVCGQLFAPSPLFLVESDKSQLCNILQEGGRGRILELKIVHAQSLGKPLTREGYHDCCKSRSHYPAGHFAEISRDECTFATSTRGPSATKTMTDTLDFIVIWLALATANAGTHFAIVRL